MIIKNINASFLPKQDRLLLKIAIQNSDQEQNQFQFLLTRRIIKSMIQPFKKVLSEKNSAPQVKKKLGENAQKKSYAINEVIGPNLVTDFSLKKHKDKDSFFLLSFILNKEKVFHITCSKKIIESLFGLFRTIQEKADWNLEDNFNTTKKIKNVRGRKPIKRTLH